MRRELSAGIIVYAHDMVQNKITRSYLLLQYHEGYWDLAKGKLEEHEGPVEAAQRELKEETGLEAILVEGFKEELFYTFRAPDGVIVDKKVTLYLGESSSNRVDLSHEHLDYCWLSYGAAHKKLTFLNAKTALESAELFLEMR